MIQVEHLGFRFPKSDKLLFRNLAFSLDPGEKTALTGPSGIGKTTLIQILAGLLPFQSGTLSYDGNNYHPRDDAAFSRLRNSRMGVVFQDYNLLRDLTVAENLELRLAIAESSMDETGMKNALARVDMADYLHTRVGSLSGGQQQRVAVVRALITEPSVVLADEPTGNLDDVSAGYVIDLLAEAREDRAVVVATHDHRVLERIPKHTPFESLEVTR